MPEPAGQQPRPLRTWRPMVLWTAIILLTLGLTWFVGAVAVPVYQTREVVLTCDSKATVDDEDATTWPADHFEEAIRHLGGPERAAERLGLYLRVPPVFTTRRGRATMILGRCGRPAVPALIRALSDPHENVQLFAARALGGMGSDAADAVPALDGMLRSENASLRRAAAEALARICGEELRQK